METEKESITPLFLIGARRSGTTLFRVMLNRHPHVAWKRGWEFAVNFIDSQGRVLKNIHTEKPEDTTPSSMEEVRAYLNEEARMALGKEKILGVTVHVGFKKIPHLYKNAKYIHIIRDPRDIAISSVKLGWSASYYHAPDIWITAEKEWETLKSIIDENSWMELRYENFVTQPKIELRKICNFIGVNNTDVFIDCISPTKYSCPMESLAFRWKKKLTKYEVQLIESRVGNLLDQRNYQPSGYPLLTISSTKALTLKFRNFTGIKARGIKDEGFLLYLTGFLGRKLGINSLNKVHKKKLQEIKQKHREELEKNY
ncbi:sulfotransferase family protein [Desulfocicer niacini]